MSFVAALALASSCSASVPMPDANPYVRGLVAIQRKNEDALSLYAYDVSEAREDLDADGRVERRRTRDYEVFHVKGRPVRRLVARDGRPLPPAERERVERKARELAEALRAGTAVSEQPALRLSRILERYDFRPVGAEEIDGRCALVFDFSPRSGHFDLGRDVVLRKLAGRLWVDEAEQAAVRLEVRNTGGVRVALGLGANVKTVSARAEFQRVEPGLWLPRRLEGAAAGRKFLFVRFSVRDVMTFDHFRRFSVDVEERLSP